MAGASANSTLFARVGTTTSFSSSLKTSAKGWPKPPAKPNIFTRFGPMRICIQPMSLRSHKVRYATDRINTTVRITVTAEECTYAGSASQDCQA